MYLFNTIFKDQESNKNIIVSFFFILYFILGSLIFNDYGISFDEDIQRIIAQNRLDYISSFFSNKLSGEEVFIKWPEYGITFELPALWLEQIFGITESRTQYFFRHYLIFLTSFIGSIFFYLLTFKRFKSWKISLLGTVFLVTSPRIFAESFYNSKDIIFMYFFIINTYFVINFLENPNKLNAVVLSLVSALCIGVRVAGLILPLLTLFFLFIKYLRKDYNFKISLYVFIFLLSLFFFIFIFWPSLWENPIKTFIYSISSYQSYDYEVFNFYLGEYTSSKAIHWFYIPLWVFITTPLIIIIFFIYGFLFSITRIYNRLIKINEKNRLNDLWRGPSEFKDLLFLILLVAPIFFIIIFKSTLYAGWRHVYFLYPYLILIALYGLKNIYIKFEIYRKNNIRKFLTITIIVLIVYNLHWLYKNHPFQNNYFNIFAGEKPHNSFEVDSWGLSNKFVLEKILKEDNRKNIVLSAISVTSLIHNIKMLTIEQRKRITYSGNLKDCDYIINNNIFISGDNSKIKKIPRNFVIYYQLFVDSTLVTTIYKKTNQI